MKDFGSVTLSNGVEMPLLVQGLPLILDFKDVSKKDFMELILYSIRSGVRAFDTSREYGKSETYIGCTLQRALKEGLVRRQDLFITSKIGNAEQYKGQIEAYVDHSLRTMKLDYLDLMLLHWPTPDYYLQNWGKLEKVYRSGKVRAIGIANCLERHLAAIEQAGFETQPHVVQFEYHPFRTVPSLVAYCKGRGMQIQAYSALCLMIPMVVENALLKELALKYERSIPQIMLRWVIQQQIAPIFRTYKMKNLKSNLELDSFLLEEEDMRRISALNINYKYHPESLNCAGF